MTLDEMISELDLYGFEDLEDDQKTLLLDEAYFDIIQIFINLLYIT